MPFEQCTWLGRTLRFYAITPSHGVNEIHFMKSTVASCESVLLLVDYVGGWAAFTVSMLIIGGLTAVIGDVAAHFGCTVGLKDSVTALSFVALGTSVPGPPPLKLAHSSRSSLTLYCTNLPKW